MRLHRAPLVLLGLAAPAAAQGVPGIDSLALRAHTYYLAHDLLEGRGTGTRGGDVAALYLASEAERLGLHGAGPGGSYFQPVPLEAATVDTARTALVLLEDGPLGVTRVRFRTPETFVLNVGTARTLVDFGGELVWVGSAADVLGRPPQLPALSGRVALMAGVLGADLAAADTLRCRGATGIIHLIGQDETFDLYRRSRGPSRLSIADSVQAVSSFIPRLPSLIAGPVLARRLLAGVNEADLARAFVLPGRRVAVTVAVAVAPLTARNVAALLPGSDRTLRGETVVLTAHYDHLGISTPDARGDSVYNGFSDNAAGSAMLLAVAQVLAARPTARSVLFVWFTGEERGLLGSDFFAARPLLPPHRMVAAINLDAGAPPGPSVTWRIAGGDRSTLGALAVETAGRAGWEAQVSAATPNSDYFPFLRIGVPAVFLVPGPGAFEGMSTDASQELRRTWDRYHHAGDHWAPDFPFAGLVRYADLALRLVRAAGSGRRPTLLPR
jgi:hypothetical protein